MTQTLGRRRAGSPKKNYYTGTSTCNGHWLPLLATTGDILLVISLWMSSTATGFFFLGTRYGFIVLLKLQAKPLLFQSSFLLNFTLTGFRSITFRVLLVLPIASRLHAMTANIAKGRAFLMRSTNSPKGRSTMTGLLCAKGGLLKKLCCSGLIHVWGSNVVSC
ncbi:unnamed protein product [Cuscuta campestris]|uniref:Uncharacterized protein n=1 Tax=Cuscuta campestris TaxID=132261 RepID=A0A484MME0_9ASTE|nr:unnamed protein product [Cuscuta campestris]